LVEARGRRKTVEVCNIGSYIIR